MLDFTPVRAKQVSLQDFCAAFTPDDLRRFTREMLDTQLGLIAECQEADVTFMPSDPQANDTFSSNEAEKAVAWTLGHVIVHATASAEEAAVLAAELARGVQIHGRSRAEVAWESVTTLAQCRARLNESRRMRLASLDLWPDQPQLDLFYTAPPVGDYKFPAVNAVMRFVGGLMHDDAHLGQLAEIVRQARAARS